MLSELILYSQVTNNAPQLQHLSEHYLALESHITLTLLKNLAISGHFLVPLIVSFIPVG